LNLTRLAVTFVALVQLASAGLIDQRVVHDSLVRVHPRCRASWLKERGVEDPYYTAVRRPDSGQGLVEVGRWSYGPSYDVDGRVTASETLVALARGSGVSLLRFSRQDSLSIELLSDINAEGLMCRVKVVDTLLYVGSRGGLEVYDIADEQNPVRLSWTPIPLNDFVLQDSLVYTISGDDLFRIYNVSNPASPVFRGSCADSGDLVSVAGNAAFIGGRWGLYVVDVTNPASPHRIGSWGSAIEQVQARGRLCYVTTFNPNVPGEITFHVLDVAVPSLPYEIGSLDSVGGYDVYLVDTLAFCSGDADLPRFSIVSVADSAQPRAVSTIDEPGWGWGAWASGLAQAAFTGCHREGLQVFDTRNTSAPVRDTGLLGADQAVDIEVTNGRAYVADYNAGLQIVDISVPSRPVTLGCFDSSRTVRSATARDSFAFVSWPWPRMVTLDVTDSSNPLRAAGCEGMFAYPEDMVLRDSFVYCAEMNRFQIVNVARPRVPALVGSCVLGNDSYGLDLVDTLAYVATYPFSIINVQDAMNPAIIGTISRGAWNGSVRDTLLFLSSGGILVYDISQPNEPRLLDSLSVGPNTYWVEAVGSLLYTGNRDGIRVVDAADIHNMRVRGFISAPYTVDRLTYKSPYVYAVCWEAGVSIYESTQVGVSEAMKGGDVRTALSVRPNPAVTDAVLTGLGRPAASVTIRDIAGRDVQCATERRANGDVLLGVAKMPRGVYFVESRTGVVSVRVKFVKQ
jgi:hypothetical protein